VLIANDGTDAVTGTFAGIAEGGTVTVKGTTFTVSYKGGDGNDVALTVTAVPVNVVAVVGAPGQVNVFNTDGSLRATVTPFAGFSGQLSAASGNLTTDFVQDVVVGATGTMGGHVKVIDGATGAEVRSFFAFEGFNGGISVAAGDVDGDGLDDVIVA